MASAGVTISAVQRVTVVCEGPRCMGKDGNGPLTLTWEETVQQQPPVEQRDEANLPQMPDEAYRLVVFQPFVGPKHVFCCLRCEHDWQLQHYVPARSPREMGEELKANTEAIRRREQSKAETAAQIRDIQAATKVLQAEQAVVRNPEALGDDALAENPAEVAPEAVPQADGDSTA